MIPFFSRDRAGTDGRQHGWWAPALVCFCDSRPLVIPQPDCLLNACVPYAPWQASGHEWKQTAALPALWSAAVNPRPHTGSGVSFFFVFPEKPDGDYTLASLRASPAHLR